MQGNLENKRFLMKFTDIIRYLGDGIRPYEEGERVFLSNRIIYCGISISKKLLHETHIFALCVYFFKTFTETVIIVLATRWRSVKLPGANT